MSKRAFDPNKRQSGCTSIRKGSGSWVSRVKEVKDKLRDELARFIPPAYLDRIEWYTCRYKGKTLDGFVTWRYPGQ